MEIHRDLTVEGAADDITSFVEEITDNEAGWTRLSDVENRLWHESKRYVGFQSEGLDGPPVRLWLLLDRDGRALRLGNIVPAPSASADELSIGRYNAIAERFHDEVVEPAARGRKLEVRLSDGLFRLDRYLDNDSVRKLEAFSHLANRGGLHPTDRERWNEFLIAAHKGGTRLDGTLLRRWLMEEEGWLEDFAAELVVEFENARGLLSQYDRQPISA